MLKHNPQLKKLWEAVPKTVNGNIISLVPSKAADDFLLEFSKVIALDVECPHFITPEGQARCKQCNTTKIEVVEAPGDLCGNTRKLPNGDTCPGCRACQ